VSRWARLVALEAKVDASILGWADRGVACANGWSRLFEILHCYIPNPNNTMYITLSPAYGRDYTKRSDILADLLAERDFVMHGPWHDITYVNLQQLEEGQTLNVRYSNLRKVAVFAVDALREQQAKRAGGDL
jgi:hypothetical protein